MTDRDQLTALRRQFFTGEHSIASPDCLDSDTIAALADGALDANARGAALRHVARCTMCREAVASVADALADGAVTHEINRVEGGRRWRWPGRVAISVAAAAILVVLLRAPTVETPAHRAPPPTVGAVPVPQAPLGVVDRVERFQWTTVAGSDQYRFTLFDATGRVLFTAALPETALRLPDSADLVPHHTYLWKVDAAVGLDRWVSSELVEFSISPTPHQ